MARSKSIVIDVLRKFSHFTIDFMEMLPRWFYAISKVAYTELHEGKGNSIFRRFRAFSMGYTTNLFNYFNEKHEDGCRYCISEFDVHYRLRYINYPYGVMIVDKHIMHVFLHKYHEFLPKLYFHISNGIFRKDGVGGSSDEDLLRILKREGRLILKNTDILKHGGFKVYLMEYKRDADEFMFNGKVLSQSELIEKIHEPGDYVISEYVRQADYSAAVFPDSVNTIRIVTLYDCDTDDCWIASATHRFGTKKSGFVDNIARGGISVDVDIRTGALKDGTLLDPLYKIIPIREHPDTGVKFDGLFVKNWLFIREKIIEMGRYAFKTPFIGWDVAVTDDSFKIIEINDRPDIQLSQYYYPLLKDERTRRFFARYNVKPK